MFPRRNKYQSEGYRAARREGFNSHLEVAIAHQLKVAGIECEYEAVTLQYRQPEELRRYTPDFILPNGIVVEAKGEWPTADRKKIKLIKEQYPDLDLRFVFSRSSTRISKQSQTTYAKYCRTLNIPFADKLIPESWLHEPVNEASLAIIQEILRANQLQKA